MSFSREHIVSVAESWLGTPYHHQAYVKGAGADCLGLLRGVFIELYGYDPEPPPRYSPAWGEVDKDELLLKAAGRYLVTPDYMGWKLGDVLVFRVKNARSAKHCGIVTRDGRMVHAVSNQAVIETTIGVWSTKIAGIFSFPGAY